MNAMVATPDKADDPKQNRILAGLQDVDYSRFLNDLEGVSLQSGQVLYKPGEKLEHVYFPTSGIVSRVFTTQNGSSAGLAMTGNDGFVGIPLVLGGVHSAYEAVVQSKGYAYRLSAEVYTWELEQSENLLQLSLAYVQALMTQIAQSVVCNRHHQADQQLCRWLLLSLDLLGGNQIEMTQEIIANMLGVRRECITAAAGKLQAAGLIHYSRGRIVVVDRPGIEQRACECYHVVKSEYDRLFGQKHIPRSIERFRHNPATLRQRAENRLQEMPVPPPNNTWDSSRMIQELQIHQIELEMNNEELKRAYDETDALRAHYVDIYDFAPAPYLTLNSIGSILEMNLAAAILIKIKRSHKDRHRFQSLLTDLSLPIFQNFLNDILNGKAINSCEVTLKPRSQHPETLIKLEGVPNEESKECRINMSKI